MAEDIKKKMIISRITAKPYLLATVINFYHSHFILVNNLSALL